MRKANKVRAASAKVTGKRRSHKVERSKIAKGNRVQNLNTQRLLDSKQGRVSGRIDNLDDGGVGERVVRRPIEQAIINWKLRQSNAPWWWLSFSKASTGNLGVCVVQGYSFLDAVNRANKLGVSVPGAAIYAEELIDMVALNEGVVDRLMSEQEAEHVFKSGAKPEQVTEQGLFKAREDEVRFRAAVDKMDMDVTDETVH